MLQTRMVIITAALFASITLAAACGGDDGGSTDSGPLTLEEYFAQFEKVDAQANSEVENLLASFPGGADVPEEEFYANEDNLPFFKELLASLPDVVQNAIDGFEALNPPDDVAEAHDAMLTAADAMLAALQSDADAAAGAESMEEAVIASQGDASLAASLGFETACRAVVDVADAQGIETNITCLQGSE